MNKIFALIVLGAACVFPVLGAPSMVLTPSCNTAATTCTSSAITEHMRVFGTYPLLFGVKPSQQTIAITNGGDGTLTWTAALTGGLTTSCAYGGACLKVTGQYNGTSTLSGTAPSVAKLNFNTDWYGGASPGPTAGTYTGTLTFTPNVGSPQAVTITIIVDSNIGMQETDISFPGYPVGCASSAGNTYDADCAVEDEGTLALPSINSAQTDGNFGGTYKRCTPQGRLTEYGSTTPFSASGTYIVTYGVSDTTDIKLYATADCTLAYSTASHGNIAAISMSGVDDQAYWYFDGTDLIKYNFVTNAVVDTFDYSVAPYSFTGISNGGTQGISNDEWISFFGNTTFCAVNLVQLLADGSPNNDNTYCASILATTTYDWAGVWAMDTVANKRFAMLSGGTASSVWYVGTTGSGDLEPWFTGPSWPGRDHNDDAYPCAASGQGSCFSSASFTHLGLFVDESGNAQLFGPYEDPNSGKYMASYKISAGPLMMRNVEEGGGLHLTQWIANASFDMQPGCADVYGCVFAPFLFQSAATRVNAATAANPSVITTTTSHGYSNGTHSIRIDGAAGGTFGSCLSGVYPMANVTNSTTITVTGANCSGAGTYTANSANQGDAETSIPAAPSPQWSEVVYINPGQEVRQLMMSRAIIWSTISGTTISSYDGTTRSAISRNGQKVAFNSNWGLVQDTAVFIADTGVTTPTVKTSPVFGGSAVAGPGVVQ